MFRTTNSSISRILSFASTLSVGLLLAAVFGCDDDSVSVASSGIPSASATQFQVQTGRNLVIGFGCGDCHNGGKQDPTDPNWLSGYRAGIPGQPFQIGPFQTYPANLTPHATAGLGGHTDRQIYNALKFGLDPEDTADVTITSTTPGSGNFPATPHYLAPPMPWIAYRHLTDDQIWSIVAYLKHGIKAVDNTVPSSGGPGDFWASSYVDSAVGPKTIPTYPASNEVFSP